MLVMIPAAATATLEQRMDFLLLGQREVSRLFRKYHRALVGRNSARWREALEKRSQPLRAEVARGYLEVLFMQSKQEDLA